MGYCYLCDEYPCKKFDGAHTWDSFITHKNMLTDAKKAKAIGIEEYQTALNTKVEMLKHLLENYDDGRRKSFFCNTANLLDLEDLGRVMAQIEKETKDDDTIKQKAMTAVSLLQAAADKRGIELKLRKKPKA